MPEWGDIVKARLGSLGLGAPCEEEIAAELAGHLEDVYEVSCRVGRSGDSALRRTLAEVPDWTAFSKQVRSAKLEADHFRTRLHTLWFPGVATGTLAGLVLAALQRTGFEPVIVMNNMESPLLVYGPWLLVLPLIGGMGAYISRRFGGGWTTRILVALSPVLLMAAMMHLSLFLWLFIDRAEVTRSLHIWASMVLNWVFLPGIALLLGAMPFLLDRRP